MAKLGYSGIIWTCWSTKNITTNDDLRLSILHHNSTYVSGITEPQQDQINDEKFDLSPLQKKLKEYAWQRKSY